MRYTDNYSEIFKHIQEHSAIFTHVLAYWRTLRHTETYSCITEAIFKNSVQLLHIQLCDIQNPDTFKSQNIFKSLSNMQDNQASSGSCHNQNIMQAFSRIFRDIKRYPCITIHTYRRETRREKKVDLPWHFLRIRNKMLWFWEKAMIKSIFEFKFSFKI